MRPLKRIFRNLKLFLERKRYATPLKDIFKRLSIETQTECNYECRFCSQANTARSKYILREEVFEKIVDELDQIGYSGSIGFQLNNEPLMDNRITKLIAFLKSRCPKTSIDIITNGSLLNKGLTGALFEAGLDLLCVNDYSSSPELRKHLMEIRHWFKGRPIRISKRCNSEYMTNRAGNAAKTASKLPLKRFCHRPFSQMCIGANGKAVLCCCDFKYEMVLGDMSNESLMDIWFGKRLASIRKQLYSGDRSGLLCERCDFNGYL